MSKSVGLREDQRLGAALARRIAQLFPPRLRPWAGSPAGKGVD